jgi:deazaflavin-dependent oxidoreductase (nitroreductase family)
MNPMTRLAILVGRQPWMPKFLPQIVWLDQTIHRLTRGRFSLLSLAGLPELFLTVRGRKSGEPRTTPLLCVPHNGSFLVAGSNWGAPKLPIWVLNLRDAGQAVVDFKGHKTPVSARQAEGDERARLWTVMNRTWPNYDHYASRTDREIPVFVLTPA